MELKRIAILIDAAGAYGRRVMHGIAAVMRAEPQWLAEIRAATLADADAMGEWRPSAVIGELRSSAVIDRVRALGVPVVNVSSVLPPQSHGIPTVITDHVANGRLAADYFLERQFRTIGYMGRSDEYFSRVREQAMRERCADRAAFSSHLIPWPPAPDREIDDQIRRWLSAIPRPVGVHTANDGWAVRLLEVARGMDLHVPQDLAVLGCDDDELLCDMSRPPLSSISVPAERAGYEAATMVGRMLRGQPVEPVRSLPPLGVVTRQSSDVLAIHDEDLAAALAFIRANAHRPFKGEEVARQVAVSRRSLERRFRAVLRRSLLQEVHRAHVDLARRLLVQPDLPMADVADRSGFADVRRLSSVFRAVTGSTPTGYRRRYRLSPATPPPPPTVPAASP